MLPTYHDKYEIFGVCERNGRQLCNGVLINCSNRSMLLKLETRRSICQSSRKRNGFISFSAVDSLKPGRSRNNGICT